MSETRDITRPIYDALKKRGLFVIRLNSGKVRVRGGYMHLCEEGTPDLLVFVPITVESEFPGLRAIVETRITWIETKELKGKLREKQIEFRDKVLVLGHRHIVARCLDDVLGEL